MECNLRSQELILKEPCQPSSTSVPMAEAGCTCTGGVVFGSWNSFELAVMLAHPICGFCLSVREAAQQPRPCNLPDDEHVVLRRCALPPGLPRAPRSADETEEQQPVACGCTDEELEEEGDEWFSRLMSGDNGMDFSWAKELFSSGQAAEAEDESSSPAASDCDVLSDADSIDYDSDGSGTSVSSWLEPQQLDGMLCAVVLDSLWGDDDEEC